MGKPYRLDSEGSAPDDAPQPRQVFQREARDAKLPANPASLENPASGAQRVMSGWAPHEGQGSAQIRKGNIPWPEVTAADSAGKE